MWAAAKRRCGCRQTARWHRCLWQQRHLGRDARFKSQIVTSRSLDNWVRTAAGGGRSNGGGDDLRVRPRGRDMPSPSDATSALPFFAARFQRTTNPAAAATARLTPRPNKPQRVTSAARLPMAVLTATTSPLATVAREPAATTLAATLLRCTVTVSSARCAALVDVPFGNTSLPSSCQFVRLGPALRPGIGALYSILGARAAAFPTCTFPETLLPVRSVLVTVPIEFCAIFNASFV